MTTLPPNQSSSSSSSSESSSPNLIPVGDSPTTGESSSLNPGNNGGSGGQAPVEGYATTPRQQQQVCGGGGGTNNSHNFSMTAPPPQGPQGPPPPQVSVYSPHPPPPAPPLQQPSPPAGSPPYPPQDTTTESVSDADVFKLRLTVNDKKFMAMAKGSTTMADFAKVVEKQYYEMFLQEDNPDMEVRLLGVVDQFDYAVPLAPHNLVKDSLAKDQYLAAQVEIGPHGTLESYPATSQAPNGDASGLTKVEGQSGHGAIHPNVIHGQISPSYYGSVRPYEMSHVGDYTKDDRSSSPPPPPPPGPPPAFAQEGPILAQVLATRVPTRNPGSPLGSAIRALSNQCPSLDLHSQKGMNNEDEMSDSDVPLSQVVAKERNKKKSYSPVSSNSIAQMAAAAAGVAGLPPSAAGQGHMAPAGQHMGAPGGGQMLVSPQFMPAPHTFISPPQGKQLAQPQQQPEGEELSDGTWKCLKCEKILTSRRALWRHEVNAHQMPTNYQCSYCLKFLTGPSKLNKHIRLHLGIKDFQCNICANRLSSRRQLDMHMRLHSKDPKYTCQQCNRSFTRTSNLKSHMRTHTGEKPFKCKTCGRAFAHKFVLQRHERVHTGETPFICHICHKGFKQSSNLKVHLRNHSDERPYKCNLCAKAFKQNANLIAHLRSAHRVRPISRKNMGFSAHMNTTAANTAPVYQVNYQSGSTGGGQPGAPTPPAPASSGLPPQSMNMHPQAWGGPPPPGHMGQNGYGEQQQAPHPPGAM